MTTSHHVQRLTSHPPRYRATPSGGLLCGLLLLLFGVMIGVASVHFLPAHPRLIVIGWGGALVAALGFCIMLGATLRQLKNALRSHRSEPSWQQDYPWNPEGQCQDQPTWGQHIAQLLALAVGLGFEGLVIPLIYQHDAPLALELALVAAIFIFVGAYFSMRAIMLRRRYGRCRVSFEQFPFFVGEELHLRFHAPRGLGRFDTLSFCLRYVRERLEQRTQGQHKFHVSICEEFYRQERKLDTPGEHTDPVDTELRFAIPQEIGTTCMSAQPPSYWELVVSTEGSRLPFHATFLLPIYARPTESNATEVVRSQPLLESALH